MEDTLIINSNVNQQIVDKMILVAGFLKYDLDPIGPKSDNMLKTMREGAFEDITELENLINQLKQNL